MLSRWASHAKTSTRCHFGYANDALDVKCEHFEAFLSAPPVAVPAAKAKGRKKGKAK